MAKVQHFSGISKRIPFEGFDFYDLFKVTFENSVCIMKGQGTLE